MSDRNAAALAAIVLVTSLWVLLAAWLRTQ